MTLDIEQINGLIDAEDYERVIAILEKQIDEDPTNLELYWYLGLVYLLQESEELAQEIWLSILLQGTIEEVEQWTIELINFLEIKVKENITIKKIGYAKIIYENILVIQPEYENAELLSDLMNFLYKLGTSYGLQQEYEKAIIVYSDILNLNSSHNHTWHSVALCFYHLENYPEAESAILKALEKDASSDNYYGLGLILDKQQNYSNAIDAYNKVINLDPNFLNAYIALGNLYYQQEDFENALDCYHRLLKKSHKLGQPHIKNNVKEIFKIKKYPKATLYLGYINYASDNYDKAIDYFEEYLIDAKLDIELCLSLGQSYVRTNQTVRAIEFIEQSLTVFPEDLALRTFNQSILPVVFENDEDIQFYRNRYSSLLTELLDQYLPSTLDKANEAFVGINKNNSFYLAYQGQNDLTIQKKYSTYLHSILKVAYPQFCQNKILSSDINQRKIRVGFVSQHLDGLGQLYIGWLKYSDKEKFDFYIYDLSRIEPEKSEPTRDKFKQYSHQMWYLDKDDNLIDLCRKIEFDQLDILIMPEIAVSARVGPLSCLRLAPVQCTTWAHPVTSGSPCVDYFLSSDLMEPEDGDQHYSEKLIRLPNLAFPISKRKYPRLEKRRSDYEIGEEKIVYWCCQSLFKYLPQHDYIFASIAQYSDKFLFVFIESDHSPIVTNTFRNRLKLAFSKFNLNYKSYCHFLPRLNKSDFSRVTQLVDIFLDCLSWSGGFTTMEAISNELPIVTLPDKLMRARHSYAILKMLDLTVTIASNENEYINIAVRLGLDASWRQSIKDRIKVNKYRIFEDRECIVGLEQFFLEATNKEHNIIPILSQ
ncbi:tetratricopeptide repeat protein [Synechocystis sp. FACHB-383]|uniref:tetratricopeptide repeat protein n=1 Tax=Synechocystis sp. FACHB-383 TaxID=2692864 RepID=UPI0016849E93|nr:tetratricopeptide repeat protein [Synechocystis sp. FACHB-383]MBD2654405.1 tetratricopeptide repeat protein [Synechocystis sp. FACHB-383]